jgi:ABC-type polysaccharide/polyol phosphate transport system ATPase subunit
MPLGDPVDRRASGPLAQLEHVSKRYVLGQGRGAAGVLLDLIGRRDPQRDVWALRELSLELGRGEALGLVGRNGAGKTTTLRLLAGISRPTRGQVTTRGRIASLLNVGAGFHPELTGHENVLLNGVILGLSQRQARWKYDEIVDFAGLDAAYLETPVKHYSSGMYARLAFSVAVHVSPDVLLVDEVLSVGDAAFQDRSLRRMLEFRDRRQAAIIFVSHNLAAVELMCPRAIWLERGVPRAAGPTSDVLRAYLDAVDELDSETENGHLSIDSVEVTDADGRTAAALRADQPFSVRVLGRAQQELSEPVFVVTIRGDHGPLFAGNMHIDGNWPARLPEGPFAVECAFGPPRLRPGRYRVELKIKQNVRTNYFDPRVMAAFDVLAEDVLGEDVLGQGESTEASLGGGEVAYSIIGGDS